MWAFLSMLGNVTAQDFLSTSMIGTNLFQLCAVIQVFCCPLLVLPCLLAVGTLVLPFGALHQMLLKLLPDHVGGLVLLICAVVGAW